MNEGTFLQVANLTKRFPGVLAVDDVSFEVRCGEIHALLGENGAGKSTLIKLLTGIYQPDSGTVSINGVARHFHSTLDSREAGISLVPQDILIVPQLSIGRNVLLGLEEAGATRGRLSTTERAEVEEAFEKIGLSVDPDRTARDLSVPQLRMAQLARCLVRTGDVVIFDEPTAVLSEPDALHLLERLERLRDQGKAIIYVTHRLSEVIRLADVATVLRDGRVAARFDKKDIDRNAIVAAMSKQRRPAPAAEAQTEGHAVSHIPGGPHLLDVSALSVAGEFHDVSMSVSRGEIVGIAGVQGAGHGALLWAIANARPATSGSVRIGGEEVTRLSLGERYGRGVLLLPADRRSSGVVAARSIVENLAISRRVRGIAGALGLRRLSREGHLAREYIRNFDVRPPSGRSLARNLSGGNQQKVVLARALASRPRVLLVEEPTQGIDVNAKAEIHRLLRQVARDTGCAIVVASSEFEELIALCSTIHIMRSGRIVHAVRDRAASYEEILHHSLP